MHTTALSHHCNLQRKGLSMIFSCNIFTAHQCQHSSIYVELKTVSISRAYGSQPSQKHRFVYGRDQGSAPATLTLIFAFLCCFCIQHLPTAHPVKPLTCSYGLRSRVGVVSVAAARTDRGKRPPPPFRRRGTVGVLAEKERTDGGDTTNATPGDLLRQALAQRSAVARSDGATPFTFISTMPAYKLVSPC